MNIRHIVAAAGLCVAAISVAAPARAQMITASNVQSVVGYLRSQGLSATVTKDDDGDPKIESSLGDNQKFNIYFYNCSNHATCQSLQFYAGFTDSKADAAKLNTWNRTKRFGRAYIDNVGDPVVEMDIDLFGGGMSRALFDDNFRFWKILMNDFSDFIYSDD